MVKIDINIDGNVRPLDSYNLSHNQDLKGSRIGNDVIRHILDGNAKDPVDVDVYSTRNGVKRDWKAKPGNENIKSDNGRTRENSSHYTIYNSRLYNVDGTKRRKTKTIISDIIQDNHEDIFYDSYHLKSIYQRCFQ